MQINKAWLVGVVAYVLGIIAKKYGIHFNDELANQIADLVLLAIPLVIAWLNRHKPLPQSNPTIPAGPQTPYNPESYQ